MTRGGAACRAEMINKRLDVACVERGLFESREKALRAIDVSFISLKLILGPVLDALAPGGELIALVKPQFELQAKDLRKGIVKDEAMRLGVMADMRVFLAASLPGAEEAGLMDSTLKGAKGNLEFLWHLRKKK